MIGAIFKIVVLFVCVSFAKDTVSFFFDFSQTVLDPAKKHFVSEDFSLWNNVKKKGEISINYCASQNFNKAFAEVTEAPLLKGKKALHYVIREPNNVDFWGNPLKGRVQNEFSVKKGFRSFVNEVDVFFPTTMNEIKNFPDALSFFSLQEFWNDTHGKESTFKITLRMTKSSGKGKDLFFLLTADDNYRIGRHRVVSIRDSSWSIPIGEWFSLRTEIVEGTGDLGLVTISVRKNNDESWFVIFKESMQTKSAAYINTGKESRGFRSLQPLKFYITKVLVEFFKKDNIPLEVYFTNWKFIGIN